jgi:hypothetical protein
LPVFLSDVIDKALPRAVDDVVARILGATVVAARAGGHHGIASWGRFGGHLTEPLLVLACHEKASGALIVTEEEAERVLLVAPGRIVGSASNVLFERLGRILYQAEVLTHEDSERLIAIEEQEGDVALLDWLPADVLAWASARRVEAVAAALPYIRKGHFVLIDGEVDLRGFPGLDLAPGGIGREASRLYDAWRHGTNDGGSEPVRRADTPAPIPGPLRPRRTRDEEVDDILRRIREADLGFK